ncbi:MAG: presenilin family intramembrane aspartyl protease, partial [Thermoplasmatota archaeon]
MNRGEWLSLLLMGLLFVAPQMLALTAVNPFQDIGVRAFEDPGDPANILQIVVVVIAFTAFILVLARYVKNAVKYILLAVFFLSIFYILQAYLLVLAPQVALPLAGGLALTGIVLLALYPEWYVVDGMG